MYIISYKIVWWKIHNLAFHCDSKAGIFLLYLFDVALVVEDISKVRQPLPNFEAIYILTPEEKVSSIIVAK